MSVLRRIADRIRRSTADTEPWDDWPLCPDCWMRYPAQSLLEAHWQRESGICGPESTPETLEATP